MLHIYRLLYVHTLRSPHGWIAILHCTVVAAFPLCVYVGYLFPTRCASGCWLDSRLIYRTFPDCRLLRLRVYIRVWITRLRCCWTFGLLRSTFCSLRLVVVWLYVAAFVVVVAVAPRLRFTFVGYARLRLLRLVRLRPVYCRLPHVALVGFAGYVLPHVPVYAHHVRLHALHFTLYVTFRFTHILHVAHVPVPRCLYVRVRGWLDSLPQRWFVWLRCRSVCCCPYPYVPRLVTLVPGYRFTVGCVDLLRLRVTRLLRVAVAAQFTGVGLLRSDSPVPAGLLRVLQLPVVRYGYVWFTGYRLLLVGYVDYGYILPTRLVWLGFVVDCSLPTRWLVVVVALRYVTFARLVTFTLLPVTTRLRRLRTHTGYGCCRYAHYVVTFVRCVTPRWLFCYVAVTHRFPLRLRLYVPTFGCICCYRILRLRLPCGYV